ncbi:hypothetical protein NBRC111894_3556 [Sporolactobacillus inulinus]|uniref:Flagellar hook-associated protein 2 N-terminal domain-containing protein n=1 Tax=Sporolactobacillus inulinus TaxID=2078 RepID=A0A4Y1ZFP9_9BACL|nr:hypothetical protein NBRC111894_3556 [Sporolactobacillus inulinus]
MQLLEWKRDDYRSMSSQLSDLLNIVNTMTLQSSYTKAATVSDPTKVTVTPASGAGNGTYAISGVDSKPTLATAAMTHIQVNASQDFDASKPLIEQDSNLVDGITWTSHSVEIGSPESHAVSADGKVF